MKYDAKFEDMKDDLPKLYVSKIELEPILKTLSKIKVDHIPVGINRYTAQLTPRITVSDKNNTHEIGGNIYFPTSRNKLTPTPIMVHVGYKRYDDFLDLKGKLLYKSNTFRRQLEYMKCDSSWVKWFFFKLKSFLTLGFLTIFFFMLMTTNVQAEAVVLQEGTPAPFTGILITEETAKDNQKALLELDALRITEGLYRERLELTQTQSDMWKKNALDANRELVRRDANRRLENGIYFFSGAAVTILLAFAVKKSVN